MINQPQHCVPDFPSRIVVAVPVAREQQSIEELALSSIRPRRLRSSTFVDQTGSRNRNAAISFRRLPLRQTRWSGPIDKCAATFNTISADQRADRTGHSAKMMIEADGSIITNMVIRGWDNFVERPHGSMSLRFVIQPLVAAVIALRAGIGDARKGRPAYLWTALTNSGYRLQLLHGGWRDMRMPFLVSAILDAIYQLITHGFIYPLETALHCDAAGSRAVPRTPRPGKSRRYTIHRR